MKKSIFSYNNEFFFQMEQINYIAKIVKSLITIFISILLINFLLVNGNRLILNAEEEIPEFSNSNTIEHDVREYLQENFDSMNNKVKFIVKGIASSKKFLSLDTNGNIKKPASSNLYALTLIKNQLMAMGVSNYNAYNRLDLKNYNVFYTIYGQTENSSGIITNINIEISINFSWREGVTALASRNLVIEHASKFLNSSEYVSKKTDYEKISAINQYICNTFQYDYRVFNNPDDPDINYTAYQMLTDSRAIGGFKRGVCQAYSMYAYIMIKIAGFEVITIDGKAAGGGHDWNMVKLGSYWYHTDFTWNDPVSTILGDQVYTKRQDGAGTCLSKYLLISDS